MSQPKKLPNYCKFITGGLAGMSGTCIVQPLDLVKTRMQMAGIGGAKREYTSSMDCLLKTARNEGILKLWTGIGAGLLRQATYTTGRMGVYQLLIDNYKVHVKPTPTVPASMAMGILAGCAGAVIGNPAEVALIRMTTDGKLPPAERRNYKNVAHALILITKQEGIKGLWAGVKPTMGRAMIVNMTQLASYSQFKNYFQHGPFQLKEGLGLQIAASGLSGFLTTCASLPLDIAKTRIQNMKTAPGDKPQYSGAIEVIIKICAHEGPQSLWKGFTPYFFRLTPHTIFTFLFLERYNRWMTKFMLGDEGDSSL